MILLDTQAVVWLVSTPRRLSPLARATIGRERLASGLAIASVTLMELALMAAKGRVRISGRPEAWLRDVVSEAGLAVRELGTEIAAVAAYLPPNFPSDPFDRLIAATAIVERMPLVTADVRIQKSGVVRTLW